MRPRLRLNELGLSKFEYGATIEGRMVSRSNHHIDFGKQQTNKINNQNRVWYDRDQDLPRAEVQAEKE